MNDRYIDYGEVCNLPEEAISIFYHGNGPVEFNDQWLPSATRDEQIIAVREWFTSRYCDPAQETPYNSREGGYLYINGGPYDPEDEINKRFEGLVPQDVIDEVVEEMVDEVGADWAPVRWNDLDAHDSYEYFDDEISDRSIPNLNFVKSMGKIEELLSKPEKNEITNELILNMSFGMLISYLETYLAETVIFWAKKDESVLFRLATKELKDNKYKLSEIFDDLEKFKKEFINHLSSNVIWHKVDKLKPTIEHGLKLSMPSISLIMGAVITRNDIVHRGGTNKEGKPLGLTMHDVITTKMEIEEFVNSFEESLSISLITLTTFEL